MARISKEPEVRKQEILEAAVALFSEKGYEKTSMADIANKVGVAQGLCYRYFPSKEILFDHSLQEYAQKTADKMIAVLYDETLTLAQKLEQFSSHKEYESEDDAYYNMYHNEQSRRIHDQLSLRICEIMVPVVAEVLKTTNEKGETHIADYETVASFCVFGQLGILLDSKIPADEKNKRIKTFLKMLLGTLNK